MSFIRVFKEDYRGSDVLGVSVRAATLDDYYDVMDISQGIYDGDDYLPVKYKDWVQDPLKPSYVCVKDHKVVGFMTLLVVDGGRSVIMKALRVHRDYSGSGIASYLIDSSISTTKQSLPTLKKLIYTSVQKARIDRTLVWNREARLVVSRNTLMLHVTDMDELNKVTKEMQVTKQADNKPILLAKITTSKTYSLLRSMSAENLKILFPEETIQIAWDAVSIDYTGNNESNLKIITEEFQAFAMIMDDDVGFERNSNELTNQNEPLNKAASVKTYTKQEEDMTGTGSVTSYTKQEQEVTGTGSVTSHTEQEQEVTGTGSKVINSISFGSVDTTAAGVCFRVDYYCNKSHDPQMMSLHIRDHLIHLQQNMELFLEGQRKFSLLRFFFPEFIDIPVMEQCIRDLGYGEDALKIAYEPFQVHCVYQDI